MGQLILPLSLIDLDLNVDKKEDRSQISLITAKIMPIVLLDLVTPEILMKFISNSLLFSNVFGYIEMEIIKLVI